MSPQEARESAVMVVSAPCCLSSSALRVWFWFSLPKELRSRVPPLPPLQAPQPRG